MQRRLRASRFYRGSADGGSQRQCLNVTSVRQTITENVQAVDAASQTSVTLNLAAQLEENRTVTHSVIGMSMSVGMGSAAMTAGATSVESYTALENGVVTTWQKDPATGTWSTAQAPATYEQMTAANGTLMLSGISAAGAPVTTDGQVYRFTGTVDASLMSDMADVLESSGFRQMARSRWWWRSTRPRSIPEASLSGCRI